MEALLLGELGTNAMEAVQHAPGVYSFKPRAPGVAAEAAEEEQGGGGGGMPAFDTSLIPDLTHVHRAMIPGIWNRVRMSTFPENWAVIGFDTESTTRAVLESYGQGGLQNVVRHLRPDAVQFCGFRVSVAGVGSAPGAAGPTPPGTGMAAGSSTGGEHFPETDWSQPGEHTGVIGQYVFMCWVGEDASDAQRKQASMQLLFFRDYFHSANVELVVAPPPGVELDGLELHSLIASQ
jgi:hypothetical protein